MKNIFNALTPELKKLSPEQVCFIGNDLNDVKCFKLVGLRVAVNDSYPEVMSIADYQTKRKGGDGAVREVCELLLLSKNKYPLGNSLRT